MSGEFPTPALETTVVRGIQAGIESVRSGEKPSPHLVALLHAGLTRLLAQCPAIELHCIGQFLEFDGKRLPRSDEDRVYTRRLLRNLRAAGLRGLRILPGLGVNELLAALEVLGRSGLPGDLWCEVSRRLERAQVKHIRALEAERGQSLHFPEGAGLSVHRAMAQRLYLEAARLYHELQNDLKEQRPVQWHALRRLLQRMLDLFDEDGAPLLGLTCIKSMQSYEFTHAVNVTILSLALARETGLAKRDCEAVGLAAFMHDVGQMNVPTEVLERQGALIDEEWASMRRHTLHGALRLLESGPLELTASAALAALEHHLGVWGEGYPKLPAGWTPSLASQIVHITDTYDALTSRRVYRQHSVRPDRALAYMLENTGLRFDTVLVRRFVRFLGVYPPGTTVRLDDAAVGVVVRPNQTPERLHRPQVCVLLDGGGQPVTQDPIVDLGQVDPETGHYARSVDACVDPEPLEIAPASIFLAAP